MKIDFVSDIACPWCAVGLNSLEIALKNIGEDIFISLHMQPYELNPNMAREGVDAGDYLMKKYGMSPAQLQANRATLRERGAAVGFTFGDRNRVWNTFDAHRLLYWAAVQDAQELGGDKGGRPRGGQRALKHALLRAYHTEGRNPHDKAVLSELVSELAGDVGLDVTAASDVIESNAYADEVRHAEKFWQQSGINAVPSVIIDNKHLIQGGQPPDVFEQAIRQLAAASAAAIKQ